MARDELFDLAIERADTYARRVGLDYGSVDGLTAGLEIWYLKTRFAYRVPLAQVVAVLVTRGEAEPRARWQGGPGGAWVAEE